MYRIDIRTSIKCNDTVDSFVYFFIANDTPCVLFTDDHNSPALLRVTRDAGNAQFRSIRKEYPNSEIRHIHEDAKKTLRVTIAKTLDYLAQTQDTGVEVMPKADFQILVNACRTYDPFTMMIDNHNDMEFAINRNERMDRTFNSIMQGHINAYLLGVPSELQNIGADLEKKLTDWLAKRNIKVA